MLYKNDSLQKQFEENSEGLTPEEFIKDRANQLLDIWIEHDNGKGFFRNIGPYWEVFYKILKKYIPEKLTKYERKIEIFDFFNEEVEKEYDQGSDILNFMAAFTQLEENEINHHSPEDVHYIELNGDEVVYMPNKNIDTNQFLGREEPQQF